MSKRAAALMFCALLGCQDPPPKTDDKAADAGAEQPVVDPNIAEALASAQAASPGATATQKGPPPNGVFGPGEADAEHAPGTPVVVDVFDKGSGEKVTLKPPLDLGKGASFKLMVSRQIPGGRLPNVDFSITASTPEGDDAAEDQITFAITGATLSKEQPGALPPDLDKLVASLKGSKIVATRSPAGTLSDEKIELAKDVKPPVDQFAVALVDVLGLMFMPYPSEPVGKGARWMAHDRTDFSGIDVVRYRVTTVDSIAGDELAVSVMVSMYAVDQKQMPAIAKIEGGEAMLAGFAAQGNGTLTLKTSGLVPTSAQLKLPVVAQLADPRQPQRAIPLQFETIARILPGAE